MDANDELAEAEITPVYELFFRYELIPFESDFSREAQFSRVHRDAAELIESLFVAWKRRIGQERAEQAKLRALHSIKEKVEKNG